MTETHPKSVLISMANRYGMEPGAFEQTLRATVVPQNISKEQFAAFLLICQHYNLNPILKEIHGFPAKSGGIQPIVGVDGWANLINSHPQCDGFTFEDTFEHGEMTAITCHMHRKDRTHPVTATEYMAECVRDTEPWKKWPRRMLRHKALIQAARYCFGFAGLVDPDEWERSPENVSTTSTGRRGRGPATVIQSTPVTNGGTRPLPPLAGTRAEMEVVSDEGVRVEEEGPPPPSSGTPTAPPPPFSDYPDPGQVVMRPTRVTTQETLYAQAVTSSQVNTETPYEPLYSPSTPPQPQQVKRGRPTRKPDPPQAVEFDSAMWAEGCMKALRYVDDPSEIPTIERERIQPYLSEASPADIEEVMAVLQEVKEQAGLA